MLVIGLTGGIGSGKSSVASLFRQQGIVTVDADDVAREVVLPGEPALEEIRQHFGDGVIQGDGTLDRGALRQLVFADQQQRQWLEQLLHPLIGQRISEHLLKARSPYALLVSPLLLETDQHRRCQRITVVDVPESVQIERTMQRDNNSEEQVQRIIAAQMDRQKRLAAADDVIDNNQDITLVARQVEQLHQHYVQLAAAQPR
ncbi:MAG: dephospho-CoA kinase [Halomonadaceae bacterium]|nr:MAG: dephospho-CoA kinase [Halomonadaceae bacterium]